MSPTKTKCQCRCCKCYSNPYDNLTALYRIHLIFIDMISSSYKIEHVSDVLVLHGQTLSISTLGTGYMRLVTLIFNSSTHRIITSLWSHAAKLWVLIWKFQGQSSYPQKFDPLDISWTMIVVHNGDQLEIWQKHKKNDFISPFKIENFLLSSW